MASMMRLSQVARKLNIGKNTIIDFLASKGYNIDDNPNSKINEEQLGLLSKEFADSAHEKEEASGLSIGKKRSGNVIIDDNQDTPSHDHEDEEEKIFIKNLSSEAIKEEDAKTEEPEPIRSHSPKLKGLNVLGKINLDQKGVSRKKEESPTPDQDEPEEKTIEPVEKVEPVQEAMPKAEHAQKIENNVEAAPKEKEEIKEPQLQKETTPEVVEQKGAEQAQVIKTPEIKPAPPVQETKKEPLIKQEAIKEGPSKHNKIETKEGKIEAKQNETPAPTQKEGATKDTSNDVIQAKAETLKGLKVVGKIELPTIKKVKKQPKPVASSDDSGKEDKKNKKKRPRKRLPSDAPHQGGGGKQERFNKGGGGERGEKGHKPDKQEGQSQGQREERSSGDRLKKVAHKKGPNRDKIRKGKHTVQKEELSEKEIQEQIRATLARLGHKGAGHGSRSKYRREKRQSMAEAEEERLMKEQKEAKVLKVNEFISANDLASMMNVSVNEVISTCMGLGLFVSINQRLDAESITVIADEFGYDVQFIDQEENLDVEIEEDSPEDLQERAPIVTIMGHVDHGKTSLLDYIRNSNVTEGEAGGITQHIGAYDVMTQSGKRIAFLDTPGHEAFTAMRARGAKLTDIVVIVVAADDAVMPQTKEAINHAQVAEVPIVIAINKIDKPNANIDKIKEELANNHILVEDWGGKYQCQEISAKTGQGIDDLLEKILLEAEMLELQANPDKFANGTVIEAELDKGRGYVATVLVQEGSLNIGDIILAGAHHGRVKAMFDHRGVKLESAPPSTPVQVLGLDGAPQAGDKFNVMETEREAREIANRREQLLREQNLRTRKHITLDEIGRRLAIGNFKELNIIVKGDVDGSVEALSDSLLKLSTDEVAISIIHKAVGQISESDVLLASASDAIIVGFQVRPSQSARKLAENEEIEIRLYSIIYDAINEIKDAMEGMLAPEVQEVIVGNSEIREIFKISKIGTVAGCMITDGIIKKNNKIRLVRDGIVIYTGDLGALKRFKEDVTEVRNGFECGMSIKNVNDLKVGDVIESFEEKEIKRTL